MTPGSLFHPAVAAWFERSFAAPTPAQLQAWPAIQAGRHTLIAAPTGSGKTLAAFLAAIDGLVRQGLDGKLPDATQVVYVSPLKALSNDIQRNLEVPVAGIRSALCGDSLVRIGLSATQNPIEEVARLLGGAAAKDVAIIDSGHQRPRELALEVPESPLEAVMSAEVWQEVYDRLTRLVEGHRTTL